MHPSADAETRERLQLVSRASLGAIFARAVEHRSTDGAESELQAALDLAPNQVPIDLLRAPVEHRAITPAPTHVGASEQAVLMPIFADGDAAFLGVDQVTVPNGDAVFPVLTNRPTVGGPHSDSTEVEETTGAFTAELVKPARLQAAFTYRRVDVARFSAMGESLRQALNEALSESLDVQIVSGANGLLGGENLDAHAQAAVDTFSTYVSKFGFSRVDGRYAPTAKAVKVLMGAATYAHAGSVYRGDQSQESAVDRLMTITGGVRVSAHVPAVASTKQQTTTRPASWGATLRGRKHRVRYSESGAGAGIANPAIAVVPLGESDTPVAPTKQPNWAKATSMNSRSPSRRQRPSLARTFGVDPSSIKITVEA